MLISFIPLYYYISVVMHKEKEENGIIHIHHTHPTHENNYRNREVVALLDPVFQESDVFLQVSVSNHF